MTSKRLKPGSVAKSLLDSSSLVDDVFDRILAGVVPEESVSTANKSADNYSTTPASSHSTTPPSNPIIDSTTPARQYSTPIDSNSTEYSTTPTSTGTLNASNLAGVGYTSASNLAGIVLPNASRGSTIQLKSKKKHQLNVRMDSVLLDSIKVTCALRRKTVEGFITEAASMYLDYLSASMLAQEDIRGYKSTERIISSYEKFTGQKWKDRDDLLGHKFNDDDPRLVDICLIDVTFKKLQGRYKKERIKSFNYFVVSLENLIEQCKSGQLPIDIAYYHQYAMSKWNTEVKPLRDKLWNLK